MIENPRKNELSSIPYLNTALDYILAQWQAVWGVEHDGDGHHTDITATSITVGDSGIDEDGNVTGAGTGPHTFGEIVLDSSGIQEHVTMGGTTNGWRMARKAASSPLNGTYALAFYDMASSAFPVLELGTVAGVYHLLPHDSATLALGHGASSGDRILALYVQNGMFETGRTVAAGYWQADAFSAGNFTAQSGTWTVDSGDVTHLRYQVTGKTMTVSFFIVNTDVSATPTYLRILIPGGYTAATATRNCISTVDAAGTPQYGMVLTAAADAGLYCYRDATGTTVWTTTAGDNTTVSGQITFEVQ